MAIQPKTNLFLLKSPLQLSNKHQITFESKEEQFEFFYNLPKIEIDNISYQRKNNIIRFSGHIDSVLEYNYVMYQNENYLDKWFYAFIVNMTYENDGTTFIEIATDCFQTWQFDLHYKQSYVEREMIDLEDDVAGRNLIPEGLELGEPIVQSSFNSYDFEPAYIIAYSGDRIGNVDITQDGASYNGIYSSIKYILCNPGGFKSLMSELQNTEYADYIVTCFTVPILAVKSLYQADLPLMEIMDVSNTENPVNYQVASRPTNLNGYTPKNKKLLTYPYCYLAFNSSTANPKIYRFEDFTNGTANFQGMCEVNPNPQIAFIPQNYKGLSQNLDEIGFLTGYPTVSYKTDTFNSWLARNLPSVEINLDRAKFNYLSKQGNESINAMSSAIGGAINGVLGNPYGIIAGIQGVAQAPLNAYVNKANYEYDVQSTLAQLEAQSLLPDNVSMSSSNATLLGYQKVSQQLFTTYTIKEQFARRIDNFFEMFGYKTNSLKIPNIHNRKFWNYLKTTSINILADIPSQDLELIKNMFDNGVTLWHNTDYFLDYSQNNHLYP